MPLTPLPQAGPIDQAAWYTYDIEVRQADYKMRVEAIANEAAATLAYRNQYLAALKANTAAISDTSEADLVRAFMHEMAGDWAQVSRGPADNLAKAKAMAQAYKAAYPIAP